MNKQPMTPGERLAALLEKRGITPTEFGERVHQRTGMKGDYNQIWKWMTDRGFGLRNQRVAADILDVDQSYFAGEPGPRAAPDQPKSESLEAFLADRTDVTSEERAYLLKLEAIVPGIPSQEFWGTQLLLVRTTAPNVAKVLRIAERKKPRG